MLLDFLFKKLQREEVAPCTAPLHQACDLYSSISPLATVCAGRSLFLTAVREDFCTCDGDLLDTALRGVPAQVRASAASADTGQVIKKQVMVFF